MQADSGQEPPMVVAARPIAEVVVAARPIAAATAWLTPRQAGLDALMILVVAVLGQYAPPALALLTSGADSAPAGPIPLGWLLIGKWTEACVAAMLLAYLVFRLRIAASMLGLRKDGLGRQCAWGVATLCGAYAYLFASGLIVLGLSLLVPEFAEENARRRFEFMENIPTNHLGLTLLLMAAVAFHEEALFRAMLLPLLRIALGSWMPAVLASSSVFALLHVAQGVFAVAQIFGLSLLLSVFFIRSRSLLAVVLAHFAFNVIQSQVARMLKDFMERHLGEQIAVAMAILGGV